jgi:stage V sporulation protein AC
MTDKKVHKEYLEYVNKKSPNSKLLRNIIYAYIIGGLICVIGQIFINFYEFIGLAKDEVSAATAITMVFLGAFLTGIDVYDSIAKYGGAGTLVPITGFANSIVSPAIEFKTEGYIMGIGGRMFVIAGPVLVYGITTSVIVGIIYYFI